MAKIDTEALEASAKSRARPSNGVTLVAGYGDRKPEQFEQLLSDLTRLCAGYPSLAGWIRSYDQRQIHATIVGLEGKRCGDSVVQENIRARLGGTGPGPSMNLAALLDFFAVSASDIPIVVGGFQEDNVNPFDFGRKPFQRSFDIRPDGLLVGMGWPHTGAAFTPYLIGLRRYLETFNVVHKYHVSAQDQDNDLFFVIGEIDADRWTAASDHERDTTQKAINQLVTECRQLLSQRRYAFSLGLMDFQLVNYKFTSLAEVFDKHRVTEIDVKTFLSLYPNPA